MSRWTNLLWDSLRRKLPDQSLLLLPGECFYTRSFLLPEGIAPDDIAAFAELSLEGVSPYPMEHLAWGFFHLPPSRRILVYATSLGRLREIGYETLAGFYQVLPSFIPLFGQTRERPTALFLGQGRTLSLLFLEADDPVPTRILSRPLPAAASEPSEGDWENARDALWREAAPEGYVSEPGLWLAGPLEAHDRSLVCRLRRTKPAGAAEIVHELPFSPATIWQVDLRDAAYAGLQRKERALSDRVWVGARAAVYTLAVLLFLQVSERALWGANRWRAATVEARREEVRKIENEHDLMQRIEQFSVEALKPFAMLNALNENRPATVYFLRAQSDGWNRLKIEGQANTLDEVNRFVDAKRTHPLVEHLNLERPVFKQGKASFNLVVTFRELPDYPVPAPAEAAPADNPPAADSAASGSSEPSQPPA